MRIRDDLQQTGRLYFDIVRVAEDDQFNSVISLGRLGPNQASYGTSGAKRVAEVFVDSFGADGEEANEIEQYINTLSNKEHLTGRINASGVMDELERWIRDQEPVIVTGSISDQVKV